MKVMGWKRLDLDGWSKETFLLTEYWMGMGFLMSAGYWFMDPKIGAVAGIGFALGGVIAGARYYEDWKANKLPVLEKNGVRFDIEESKWESPVQYGVWLDGQRIMRLPYVIGENKEIVFLTVQGEKEREKEVKKVARMLKLFFNTLEMVSGWEVFMLNPWSNFYLRFYHQRSKLPFSIYDNLFEGKYRLEAPAEIGVGDTYIRLPLKGNKIKEGVKRGSLEVKRLKNPPKKKDPQLILASR